MKKYLLFTAILALFVLSCDEECGSCPPPPPPPEECDCDYVTSTSYDKETWEAVEVVSADDYTGCDDKLISETESTDWKENTIYVKVERICED